MPFHGTRWSHSSSRAWWAMGIMNSYGEELVEDV